jgi:hypothetical protein
MTKVITNGGFETRVMSLIRMVKQALQRMGLT